PPPKGTHRPASPACPQPFPTGGPAAGKVGEIAQGGGGFPGGGQERQRSLVPGPPRRMGGAGPGGGRGERPQTGGPGVAGPSSVLPGGGRRAVGRRSSPGGADSGRGGQDLSGVAWRLFPAGEPGHH